MNRNLVFRRLIAIVMIAGIALAPLSRPVMAGTGSDVAMDASADGASSPAATEEMAVDMPADMAVDMAMDMPCCPSKAPAPPTCDKCMLMAGCLSTWVADISTAGFEAFPKLSTSAALLQNDFEPDGLGHPPPEHPPRRLV